MKRNARVAALAAALAALPVAAEMIDIAWSGAGSFERETSVAPGKFVEVCGELKGGTAVDWRFGAGAELEFNVHYHEGRDVRYPVPSALRRQAEGRVQLPADQALCWMWTNPSAAPVRLELRLVKR